MSDWIGWNGGECPVHPKTTVDAVYCSNDGKSMSVYDREAEHFVWESLVWPVVAYRIVKKYQEPREFWLFAGKSYTDKIQALTRAFLEGFKESDVIHVREVLDENS